MKKYTTKLILALLVLLGGVQFTLADPSTGIAQCFKLDESSGSAFNSAVGSTLSLTNTGSGTYSAAKINNGFTGNGSSSYLSSSTEALTFAQLGSTWSVSFWIKRLASPAGASYAFRLNGFSGSTKYFILYYFSGGAWHINTGGADVGITYTDTGGLDHIVLTYDGVGTIKTYVNDVLTGSPSFVVGTTPSATTGKIGLLNDPDGGAPLNAQIDEFVIWTKTLTQADVDTVYNAGAGKQCPFVTVVVPFNFGNWFPF